MPLLPDGVHLHLPDDVYFMQGAIGSSDLIKLWRWREGWWWQSNHNPDRVDKPSKERTYGSATHAIVLEGTVAYESRFLISPTKPPGALETSDQIKAALKREGFRVEGTSAWRKPDWLAAARANLPDHDCWPNIEADFDARCARERKPKVSAVEDRMLRIMYGAAMADPGIRALLGDGGPLPPLAEVSILKTLADGTRRRWRLDRLYPRFTLDLKTLGNWSGRPLAWATGDHIGRNGYDIQRADYDDGRAALGEFVRDGFQVYGGSIDERDWVKRLVEMTFAGEPEPVDFGERVPDLGGRYRSWDWVWLFYQKPDPAGRAPVIFPVYDDAFSDLWCYGRRKANAALAFYRRKVAEVGLQEPWTLVEQTHWTDPNRTPQVFLPSWIGEEQPSDASAYESDTPEADAPAA